jgi:hypothetical protein
MTDKARHSEGREHRGAANGAPAPAGERRDAVGGGRRRSVAEAPIAAAMEDGQNREATLELLGLAEAAELLGLSKAALGERRRRRGRRGNLLPAFPAPIAELRCGPIWLRSQLDEYRDELARRRRMSRFERRFGQPLPWERR